MTTAELEALARLEENFQRLSQLVADQSLMLKKQQVEIVRLRQSREELQVTLDAERERSHLLEVAQGLAGADEHQRTQALSYLSDVITDIKLSIRQLEKIQ